MKHFLNLKIRTLYYGLLAVLFWGLSNFFNIYSGKILILSLLILFLLYYLFEISSFDSYKVNPKKILTSCMINAIVFFILYLVYREINILYFFVVFSIVQVILKYCLAFLNTEHIRVMILGVDIPTFKIIDVLNDQKNKFEYIGYIDDKDLTLPKCLGKIEDIKQIVEENNIQQIVFTSRKQVKVYADLVMELKLKGIKVSDYLGFLEKEEGKVDVDKIDSLWVLMSDGFESFNTNFQKRIKRAFDLILAVIIGICSLPVMIISAIIVKFESPGPIIYSQARIGENQKEFYVHKFRSMRNDAEKNGAKWAVENDPRVTKYGNFMRKTRIDELPQIWNVLKGEMSFIGPRPERQVFITEIEKVVPYYNLRHSIKPGLTGWAQVMYPYGASIEDAKQKLEYDLYYIKHQDFILDIIIMFKTVQTVIFGKGR